MSARGFLLEVLARTAARVAGAAGRRSRLGVLLRPAYERAVRAVSAGRGVDVTINGAVYRIDARHRHHFSAIYEPEVAEYMRSRVRAGQICFDVGAHVGIYVLQFARWAGPTGRIVAFEPNPLVRAALELHARLNGIASQVVPVAAAVGDAARFAVLHVDHDSPMGRLDVPNPILEGHTQSVHVPIVTLDEYWRASGTNPDWLLLDVEGHEGAALAGARAMLAARRGRLSVIAEMHPDIWATTGWSREAMALLLADLGLRPVPLLRQTDPLGEHGAVALEATAPPLV